MIGYPGRLRRSGRSCWEEIARGGREEDRVCEGAWGGGAGARAVGGEEAEAMAGTTGDLLGGGSSLYDQAVQLVVREQKASTSFVQRHLKIGYNRAATIIEEMEGNGIISAANHVGKREVLVTEGGGQ